MTLRHVPSQIKKQRKMQKQKKIKISMRWENTRTSPPQNNLTYPTYPAWIQNVYIVEWGYESIKRKAFYAVGYVTNHKAARR